VEPLGYVQSVVPVYDRDWSHLHNGVHHALRFALAQISVSNEPCDSFRREIRFPLAIGQNVCVRTDENDHILYARRRGRSGWSRFVEGREPEPTDVMTIVLKWITRSDQDCLIILTAYWGPKSPPEVWSPSARKYRYAQEFWATHALIWGSEEVEPGSVRRDKPY